MQHTYCAPDQDGIQMCAATNDLQHVYEAGRVAVPAYDEVLALRCIDCMNPRGCHRCCAGWTRAARRRKQRS